jgi:rhodanese-related sulfurtransferase
MIAGSVHIPVDQLRGRIHELNPEKPVVVYCAVGYRGYLVYRILVQNGFTVKNLSGGFFLHDVARKL